MAQQLYPFDAFSVRELNVQLMKKLGYSIKSKSDCVKLSELIFKEGLGLISQSTLYRILLYDKEHKPFYNTLCIITQFLGYIDWEDFCKTIHSKKKFDYTNGHLSQTNLEKSLLFQCVQLENYRPLEALFNNIMDVEQEAKDSVTLMLYDSLLSIHDTMPFFKHFGTNTFVRESFFEHGVDPRFRIANYDEGFKIYLSYYNPNKSVFDMQSFIFGNCVLFRHYYIKGDWDKALAIGQTLYNKTLLPETEMDTIYIFPRLRYLSLKLVYLKLLNATPTLLEDYIYYLIDYAKTLYTSLTYVDRRIVFYNLGDVFLLVKVDTIYHDQLKAIFKNEFALFPDGLLHKPLAKVLPYFEPNGLLQHRPA
jgi:hypothetical protein